MGFNSGFKGLIRLELVVFVVCQLVPATFASRLSSVDADCLAGNVSDGVQILLECEMVTPKRIKKTLAFRGIIFVFEFLHVFISMWRIA